MTTTVAAMKGKLGSTEYFIVTMKAGELVSKAKIPSELEEWGDLGLEEREQRDIKYARVRNLIAPYLAHEKDRFLGAIILTAKNFDADEAFVSISDFPFKGMPKLLKPQASAIKNMGLLTFDGGEVLIPLDGQHRLKAIQFAIEGRDEKSKPIKGLTPCMALANDDVTVIIVPDDPNNPKKARKIFTKVNKYAVKTTTAVNLILDDDDIVAVLSRKLAEDTRILGGDLVSTSNTLSKTSREFTTLAIIAECNEAILEAKFGKIDRKALPDPAKQPLYEQEIFEVWKFLVQKIDLFADALKTKGKDGDRKRCEIRRDYLLGKPVAQACLVGAFVRLISPSTNLSKSQAADKLNSVNWRSSASHWDRILSAGDKIETKRRGLVTDILCYQCGEKTPEPQKTQQELLVRYRALYPEGERHQIDQLPKLIK